MFVNRLTPKRMLEWNSNYSGDSTPVEILVSQYFIWHFKHTNGFEIKLLVKDEPLPPGVFSSSIYLFDHALSQSGSGKRNTFQNAFSHRFTISQNVSRFSAKWLLKGHTYLKKPAAFSSRFVKVSVYNLSVDTSLVDNIWSC